MIAIKAERYSVICTYYLFDAHFRFARLQVCNCQTQNDEHSTDKNLPGKFLTEENHTQQHAAQRKEVRDHAGAGGSDLVDQVIRQNKREPRTKDTKEK